MDYKSGDELCYLLNDEWYKQSYDDEVYYYHPDHLGGAAWITDNEIEEKSADFSFKTAVLVIERKSAIPDRLIQSAIEQGLISSESDIEILEMGENTEGKTQKPPQMGENVERNAQKPSFPTLTIMNVYELICQNPKIKYAQIEDNLGIDENTVHRSIAWLKENGYINKEHSKVKGVWQLID